MGDLAIIELAKAFDEGKSMAEVQLIPQVFYAIHAGEDLNPHVAGDIHLADHESCLRDKKTYAANFRHIEQESNKHQAARLLQKHGNSTVVINPPYPTFTEKTARCLI